MSQSLIETKLDVKGVSGRDTVYACPNCEGEDGSHLYVDYGKGYFNCFKCEFGGKRIGILLNKLGFQDDFDYDIVANSDFSTGLDEALGLEKRKFKLEVTPIPVDYSYDLDISTAWFELHSKPLSPIALQYLLNRGMDIQTINKYRIREGINLYGDMVIVKGKEFKGRNYSGRIMVPSLRRDGRVSFFVARDYTGKKKPKYLNPPKEIAYSSEDVWNLDCVDARTVIVAEGVFTSIAAGGVKGNSVATYGKSIAEVSNADGIRVKSQGEKLLEKNYDIYYMSYDADALAESFKNAEYLLNRGANVRIVYIDPKIYGEKADADEIGYTEYLKCLANSMEYSKFLEVFY